MNFIKAIAITIAVIAVWVFIAGDFEGSDQENRESPVAAPKQVSKPSSTYNCTAGAPVDGRFFVEGKDINFRAGPGTEFDKIINSKASNVLNKTVYRTLWPTMVLEARCETEDWLFAKIIEADGGAVNWESGWVHKQFVTSNESDEMKAGLMWDIDGESDFTAAEKAMLKRGAMKVLRDEPNCAKIITGYRSGTKKGAYYVTCTAKDDGLAFNVWFTPDDLASENSLGVPTAFPESLSRQFCENGIRERVIRPSTLDIHTFTGYATQIHNNGNRTVIQEFSAKNSFDLEIEYRARCLVLPDGTVEITISEIQ